MTDHTRLAKDTGIILLRTRVEHAAAAVYRRYYRFTTLDDTTQEVWLWLSANQEAVKTMASKELDRQLRNAAERFCRQQKAAVTGYNSVDEYHYSIHKLKRLVFDALDSGALPPQESYRDDEQYSEWMTEVADVRRALKRRTFAAGHYLTIREYVEGGAETENVETALRALQRQLGGSRPN